MAQVPAFISTEFALEVFFKMGGKGYSSDIRTFFRENYSDDLYLVGIFTTRLRQLRSYHIIDSKYDRQKHDILYFLTKEGQEFIEKHKAEPEKIRA